MNLKKNLMILALGLSFASFSLTTSAFAGADCKKYPESETMSLATLGKKLEEQGYKIRVLKVDGNCYEIYGHNKEGKKVEIYFDQKDGSVVKSNIR